MCVRWCTLDKRFADVLGYSVLTEIQNCRISRAKRLLVTTDLPIKQIAYLARLSTTNECAWHFSSVKS